MLSNNLKKSAALVAVLAGSFVGATNMTITADAQDYAHPRDLNLPDSTFQRPNPMQLQVALDNGLKAYVAADDRVPMVTISAFVKMGKISDENQGAAEALAYALKNAGTGSMTSAQMKEMLRQMVANYNVSLHDEWLEISLNVPKEDQMMAEKLLSDIVLNVTLEQSAIDGAMAGVKAKVNPGDMVDGSMTVAVDQFHQRLYAGHPYGYVPTKADYQRLTVDQVKALYQSHFVAKNITVAYSGDIDADAVKGRLKGLFAGLSADMAPSNPTVPVLKDSGKLKDHYKADKYLTWAVFGHSLPQMSPQDEAAFEVMNYILGGGHFWTRLFIETRDKYGLTNDVSGYIVPHWYGPGSYSYHASSRHDVLMTTYNNSMGEIVRMTQELPTAEELSVAHNALADGVFEDQFNHGDAAARTFAIEMLRYGNHDMSASYPERIRAVTVEDVLAAAQKYIRLGDMKTVLVGNDYDLTN